MPRGAPHWCPWLASGSSFTLRAARKAPTVAGSLTRIDSSAREPRRQSSCGRAPAREDAGTAASRAGSQLARVLAAAPAPVALLPPRGAARGGRDDSPMADPCRGRRAGSFRDWPLRTNPQAARTRDALLALRPQDCAGFLCLENAAAPACDDRGRCSRRHADQPRRSRPRRRHSRPSGLLDRCQPDRVAGRDAPEAFGGVCRVATDDEQPPAWVDDQAPVTGCDVRVGRDPPRPTRARGRVDLDRIGFLEAGFGELRLADVEEDIAEAVEVE